MTLYVLLACARGYERRLSCKNIGRKIRLSPLAKAIRVRLSVFMYSLLHCTCAASSLSSYQSARIAPCIWTSGTRLRERRDEGKSCCFRWLLDPGSSQNKKKPCRSSSTEETCLLTGYGKSPFCTVATCHGHAC